MELRPLILQQYFESIVHHQLWSFVARGIADGVARRNEKAGVLEEAVSRDCAELGFADRRASIEDLRSRDGTQVNATALEKYSLRPGDRIKIADIDLVFAR